QDGTCFFQKHPGSGTPDDLPRISIQEEKKTEDYLYINEAAQLTSLVQMSVLELHAWGSRIDKIESPDRLVFDLDPAPDVEWKQVVAAARKVGDFLSELARR